MPPSPEIFRIGDFALRWYSVMIVLGALVASWLSTREAKRRGQDPEHVWQMLPIVLILGIIGARLGWVLVSLGDIQARGWEHAFYIWEGGLSIQGAVIGGIIALTIYTRRTRLDFFEWTDIIAPGLALAQAIGRWGNYFNQEAFGGPCNYPWCIPISQEVLQANPDYQQYLGQTTFHPTFAYEMLWDLLNFGILMWLGRQKRFELRTGDVFWAYGIIYSLGRFIIEEIRVDSATIGGLKAPTIFAVITIVICWAGFIWRHRPGSDAPLAVTSLEEGEYAQEDEEWEEAPAPRTTAPRRLATAAATAGTAGAAAGTALADDSADEDDYEDEEFVDEEFLDDELDEEYYDDEEPLDEDLDAADDELTDADLEVEGSTTTLAEGDEIQVRPTKTTGSQEPSGS